MSYNVFVFCGGKCGGTTLSQTFNKNGYETTHLHSFQSKGMFNSSINTKKHRMF